MDYSNILGQEKSISYLKKTVFDNKPNHALIFEGGEGMGKMTLASVHAQSLLCTGNEPPCGKCASCIKFSHQSHPEFKTIEPKNKKTISTEDISELLSDAFLIPGEGVRKVYVIKKAHLMTPAAQNKLLKILEEPPEYLTIILLCDNISNILPTIISRSVTIKMQRLTEEAIKAELIKRGAPTERAKEIASFSWGNLGYALSALDDKAALERNENYSSTFYELEYNKVDTFSFLDKKRDEIDDILICWQKILSDCLKFKTHVGKAAYDKNKVEYAKKHDIDDIIDKLSYILQAESRLAGNAQYLPTMDWLLSRL